MVRETPKNLLPDFRGLEVQKIGGEKVDFIWKLREGVTCYAEISWFFFLAYELIPHMNRILKGPGGVVISPI